MNDPLTQLLGSSAQLHQGNKDLQGLVIKVIQSVQRKQLKVCEKQGYKATMVKEQSQMELEKHLQRVVCLRLEPFFVW